MGRWMQDIPVTSRVVAIFGLIVLLTGLMTGLVAHHAHALEGLSGDLRSRQYIGIHALADMQTLAEQLYAIKGHNLLSEDPADRAAAAAEAAEIFTRYGDLEKTLLAQTPEGPMRRVYAEAAASWRRMQKNHAVILAAAEGLHPRTEALTLYHGEDEDSIRQFRKHALALEALQLRDLDATSGKVTEALTRMRRAVFAAQFVLIALGFAGCFAVARSISRPVQDITQLMTEMSAGKLDIAIPAQARRDEIGRMAAALDVFRRNSLEARRLAQEKQRRTEALEALLRDFDSSVSGVLKTVADAATELESTAGEMGGVARGIRRPRCRGQYHACQRRHAAHG